MKRNKSKYDKWTWDTGGRLWGARTGESRDAIDKPEVNDSGARAKRKTLSARVVEVTTRTRRVPVGAQTGARFSAVVATWRHALYTRLKRSTTSKRIVKLFFYERIETWNAPFSEYRSNSYAYQLILIPQNQENIMNRKQNILTKWSFYRQINLIKSCFRKV